MRTHYIFSFFLILFIFVFPETLFAGNIFPVIRGGSVTVSWTVTNAINCYGSFPNTIYPQNPSEQVDGEPFLNGINSFWTTAHNGNGSAIFNNVLATPRSYDFQCYDGVTGAIDIATLIVSDCGTGPAGGYGGPGTTWNSTSCALPVVNGSCGTSGATGSSFTSAPTANLCGDGSLPAVSGTGPWTWSCAGSNGGTTASCSATLIPIQYSCGGTAPMGSNFTSRNASTANGTWAYATTGECTWACNSGYTQSGNSCVVTALPPSASFTSTPSCTVASGASTCTSPVSWTSANVTYAALTDSLGYPTGNYTTQGAGAVTYSTPGVTIPHAGANFYIHNVNASSQDLGILASVIGTATCIAGTAWDGAKCTPTFYSCSGTMPTGANFTSRNASTANGTWAYSSAGECTWACNSGYTQSGNSCVVTPPLSNNLPTGVIDTVSSGAIGTCGVASGWSYDPDNTSASNEIHIYLDGPAGSAVAGYNIGVTKDSRPDVNAYFGITGFHGYSYSIPNLTVGNHTAYAYGIGLDTAGNAFSESQLLVNSPITFNCTPAIVTHTITFNGNGSTGGTTATQTITEGATANLNMNGFTRTGYTFNGWATTAGGSVVHSDGGPYTMGVSNVTLYAQWTANACTNGANNPQTCNTCTAPLVFDTSSASCVIPLAISTPANSTITLPSTAFSASYTLTNGNGANSDCYLLDSLNNAPNIIIQTDNSCTGTFNHNTPATASVYGYYVRAVKAQTGETVTSPKFTVTVNPIPPCRNGASNSPTCTPAPTVSASVLPATVAYGGAFTSLSYTISGTPATSCTGQQNGGAIWATNSTFGTNTISLSGNYFSNTTWTFDCTNAGGLHGIAQTTLTVGLPPHTITFNGNGNTGGTTNSQMIAEGTTANLNANGFTRTGYTFSGWGTSANGPAVYGNGASYPMGTVSVILYAQWTINTFVVTPSVVGNGTILQNTPQTVNYYNTASFTVTPAYGYVVAMSGTCGGNSLASTGGVYTTNPITANCTVIATFSLGVCSPLTVDVDVACYFYTGNTSTGKVVRRVTKTAFPACAVPTATESDPIVSNACVWTCNNGSKKPKTCPLPEVILPILAPNNDPNGVISFSCNDSDYYTLTRDGILVANGAYTSPVTILLSNHGSVKGNYQIKCFSGTDDTSIFDPATLPFYDPIPLTTDSLTLEATPITIKSGTISTLTWGINIPGPACAITATPVCTSGGSCSAERTSSALTLSNKLLTENTDANDPYGGSRSLTNALRTTISGTKALGKKSIKIDYTTDFELNCHINVEGRPNPTKKLRVQVTDDNEG